MATEITAVVFDVGGVLVDWDPRHLYRKFFGADEAAMERFLAEVCTREWNGRLDAGRSFTEAVAELVALYPDQAELIEAWHLRWMEMLGDSLEGTVAIMRELRSAGLPIYILSNWAVETFEAMRPRYPFLEEFDGILISGEVGVGKPDPAIFREFLARFGLTAENAVFIDDWDLNVETANSLGMTAILFRDATLLRAELRRLGLPLAA